MNDGLEKRMKKTKVVLLCGLLCLISSTILFASSAKFNLGLGLNYTLTQSKDTPDINKASHKLGLEVSPSFSYGKFAMKLDAHLYFGVNPFSSDFGFWPNNWLPPVREPDESDFSYAMRVASHYSGIINYITWGSRTDDIYFRWGKLNGYTMGDGALLTSYHDTTVDRRATLPGITFKLDARAFNFPWLGFEFVTNDIFHPSLLGARLFVRPCTATTIPVIKDMEVGLSFVTDPYGHSILEVVGEETVVKETIPPLTNVAIDVVLPLLSQKWIGLSFYTDFIMQFPDQKVLGSSHAVRFGLGGAVTPWILFNGAVTFPTGNGFIPNYFETGFNEWTEKDLANNRLQVGEMRFDGRLGVQVLDTAIYAGVLAKSDFSAAKGWNNYGFGMRLHIDKDLLNFLGLDINYDKLYPQNTLTQETEPFGKGLFTLKNVSIGMDALITVRPVDLDLGLSIAFDEDGKSTGVKFDIGLRFSFF